MIVDSGADTCVVGRHAHIIEFIDGKEVSANSWNGQKTENLRIANAAFAYDSPTGETIILIYNQSIYAGTHLEDNLLSPMQCLSSDVSIDIRPKLFFPNEPDAQSMRLADMVIGLAYHGPLPYTYTRRIQYMSTLRHDTK